MMKRLFRFDKPVRQTSPTFKTSLSPTVPSAKKMTPVITPPKKETTPASFAKGPSSHFFKKLKTEERVQFADKKRHRFDYKDNYSAALKLPRSNFFLATQHHDQNALLTLSKENIIEHANRRVDLFFYTLIAYYKTGIVPTYGHTSLQHGKGRTTRKNISISEACHSSLTPSLLDKTIFQNSKTGEKHKSLLSDTHFMDSLNSTVELPPFVNDLDDLLENSCREQCMSILRAVSLGITNPITGLAQFLQIMNTTLKKLKEDAENKSQSDSSHSINPNLIDLVIKGTLSTTFSSQTQTATDAYIQLLLRMTPAEKALCKDKLSTEEMYMEKIMELQDEILNSKSKLPSP
ncbi:Uncharacterised protein [Legionella steigerwaltii]|uniref:Uncharacterized protein n=1 Tax=Legionella steigerwaltii TaxID=460 RepID=A0A378L9B7_9GAMM|nr:hypothetical protein [Legionella steigerwaltii]KTD77409.1 hypothetical protein Lstg_1766 [Legionella steigerwaltii]STY22289.1 Uncharacterised protein [Legionella steigerwaltii]